LLEVLSDFQVSVPELGTMKARHVPLVVLTSNNAREMSDALKRRCLHLFIDFPERAQELEIVRLKVPGVSERLAADVVAVVHRIRKLDLKKAPSISETLDWARALTLLNLQTLDEQLVSETLATILKYEGDIRKAQQELKEYAELQRSKLEAPFDLFFSGLADAIKELTAATAGALEMSEEDFQRFLDQLKQRLEEAGAELSPLARALLEADAGRLEKLLREAAEQAGLSDIQHGFQEGRFAHAVAQALGLSGLSPDLARLKELLAGLSAADARRLEAYLDRRLQDLADMVKRLVRGELQRQDVTRGDRQRLQALAEK